LCEFKTDLIDDHEFVFSIDIDIDIFSV